MNKEQSVTIVIPTRNERYNAPFIIDSIKQIYNYDILVVDDSDDDTAIIAAKWGARVLTGKRKGLGQAIVDGINMANSDIVVVMDADLSHSPGDIESLVEPLLSEGYDMTIGSRYVKGGIIDGWTKTRLLISKVASLLAYPLTWIRDNTSGFFAIRKEILDGVTLKADSWKIMLEILIKANPTAFKEVPICFVDRTRGESKFNKKEVVRYITHLAKLFWYKYKAIVKFGMIGVSGALLHFLLLYTFTDIVNLWYIASAILSIIVASTSNYILNHRYTFTDRQITNHLIGWFKYQVMSGITDGIYLGFLALFVEVLGLWYMLGAFLSAALVFPVKFGVASSLIWSKRIDTKDADYEWQAFYKGSIAQKWWKRRIAKIVWGWVPDASKLLDIGCGSSPIIARYGKDATGIDINKDKIKLMKKKLPDVNYYAVKVDRLYGKYDHILCIEVLEHLEEPEKMVKKISRLLKIGGLVVFATPDYGRPLWYLAELFTPYKEEHVIKFTRKSLEELCQKYALSPLSHKYVAGCDLVEVFVKL